MLKAQIARQQKYIRKLTSLLQSTRHVYKQTMEVFSFFAECCLRVNSRKPNENCEN
jgi:hypothetical protein